MDWILYVVLTGAILWLIACLFVAIYFAWIVSAHLEDAVIYIKLFCSIFFLPLWYPVFFVYNRFAKKEIRADMDGMTKKK